MHHLKSLSQLGDDVQENMITLCASCHNLRHSPNLQMVLRAIRLVAAEFRLCLLAKGHADGDVEDPGVISS